MANLLQCIFCCRNCLIPDVHDVIKGKIICGPPGITDAGPQNWISPLLSLYYNRKFCIVITSYNQLNVRNGHIFVHIALKKHKTINCVLIFFTVDSLKLICFRALSKCTNCIPWQVYCEEYNNARPCNRCTPTRTYLPSRFVCSVEWLPLFLHRIHSVHRSVTTIILHTV